MKHNTKIRKVLVVLSPDLIQPQKPTQSPLIQRAIALAKSTGCELELFHVCYEDELEQQLLESAVDLERQRKELTNRDSLLLAEMATRLKDESINVSYEARWDSPRTDAILRKIAHANPDIVMKQAREHDFVLGITTNTDWDLARRSPADVWLVNDKVKDVDRIMAAIGNKDRDCVDVTTSADYDLLRMTGLIGGAFEAATYAVNAFQVPVTHIPTGGVGAAVTPVASLDNQNRLREQIHEQHSGSVEALAQYFDIAKSNVYVREGRPHKIIPKVAESIAADMIVMGADSISRMERLVGSVTVEPVMANTNTDILVVREPDLARVPKAVKSPLHGVPKYDLERAITSPEATFDSPLAVANLPEISIELRRRILQAWEYDLRAEMAEENEGGPPRDIDVNALDEISSARALLELKQEKPDNGRAALPIR